MRGYTSTNIDCKEVNKIKRKSLLPYVLMAILAVSVILPSAFAVEPDDVETQLSWGTISGDITYTPAVVITPGYEWRKVHISVGSFSFIRSLYFYAPITHLDIDGRVLSGWTQDVVTYRGVQCYRVKIKFLQGIVRPGEHYFVVTFDPAYSGEALTHTQRGAGIDVNGDGKSSVLYSTNGIDWYEDVGVDLIYEISGISL